MACGGWACIACVTCRAHNTFLYWYYLVYFIIVFFGWFYVFVYTLEIIYAYAASTAFEYRFWYIFTHLGVVILFIVWTIYVTCWFPIVFIIGSVDKWSRAIIFTFFPSICFFCIHNFFILRIAFIYTLSGSPFTNVELCT